MQILVAGIGNIFFRDDGFGPAVAATLQLAPMPAGVRIVDYGIRGMHLTYDLLGGVDALVLVDVVPASRGERPGTVVTMRIDPDDLEGGELDAHGMSPVAVLGSLGALGGELPPTYLVGCVPADVSDGMGLSAPVAAAVEEAAAAVAILVDALVAAPLPGSVAS
jgi:hydrogenase maturation protease